MITRVTLKSAFDINKSTFCIQLMIVYVFQHKSNIFRLIDVSYKWCAILFSDKFLTIFNIDITSRDTRLPHMRFLSCARL